mgnify:FL=1
MDAVKFIMTVRRMCKNQGCAKCPVCKEGMYMVVYIGNSSESIVETISKVEQWAKDHPVKTRQSEFLKAFPNAPIDKGNGVLFVDPCTVDSTQKGNKYCSISCTTCRKNYWLAEVTDNGND